MLKAKIVLKNSTAADNCYDRTGACQTVNQFKSGPAEALEKKAKAKSKKLMAKHVNYKAKCKMMHTRGPFHPPLLKAPTGLGLIFFIVQQPRRRRPRR